MSGTSRECSCVEGLPLALLAEFFSALAGSRFAGYRKGPRSLRILQFRARPLALLADFFLLGGALRDIPKNGCERDCRLLARSPSFQASRPLCHSFDVNYPEFSWKRCKPKAPWCRDYLQHLVPPSTGGF